MRQILGEKARYFRKEQGLTLRQLSEKSGLSIRFIGEVEAGRANPSLESMVALSQALNVHLYALLGQHDGSDVHHMLHVLVDLLPSGNAQAALTYLRQQIPNQGRTLVLLGLRGAGKSTIGPQLAQALGREFHEVDHLVEEEAGMGLASLFEFHGESHYRQIEKEVLQRLLHRDEPCVLAVSGGVVTAEESWQLIRREAITMWLKASPNIHWSRVVDQGDLRPISGRSRAPAELIELYQTRQPLYATADLILDTSALTIDQALMEAAHQFQTLVGHQPTV